MGGAEKEKRHHDAGRLTVRERIDQLEAGDVGADERAAAGVAASSRIVGSNAIWLNSSGAGPVRIQKGEQEKETA
jgi:acetyl-CoA carboxylase carboxyltransferase component